MDYSEAAPHGGYYELHWDGFEWCAFDPYSEHNKRDYVFSKGSYICSSTSRDDCIACVEAMGYIWAGA
jgi:hypothetical protein